MLHSPEINVDIFEGQVKGGKKSRTIYFPCMKMPKISPGMFLILLNVVILFLFKKK